MIESMRSELDQVDQEIIELLSKRAGISTRVGIEKSKKGLPLLDANREQEILAALGEKSSSPLDAKAVQAIYKTILDEMRRLQKHAVDQENLSES
jgi:chorismate mutase